MFYIIYFFNKDISITSYCDYELATYNEVIVSRLCMSYVVRHDNKLQKCIIFIVCIKPSPYFPPSLYVNTSFM